MPARATPAGRLIHLLAGAFCFASLISCEEIVAPSPVTAIALSPQTATLTSLGDTLRVAATPKDASGNSLLDRPLTWTSSDNAVLVVDQTGLVTAVKNGTASISAAAEGITASVSLTVKQVVKSISVAPDTMRLTSLTDTARFSAVAKDARGNAVDTKLAWASTDTTHARVDSTGLVTSIGNGTASVSAAVDTVSGQGIVSVKQVAASIAVTPASVSFASIGDTARLSAVAKDARGNTMSAAAGWASSDTTRVRVDATGLATAVNNGTASIAATVGSVSGQSSLTVKQAAAAVIITPDSAKFASLGDTARFVAAVKDARGNLLTTKVTWSSSDSTHLRIDSTGLATAVANGTASIVATAEGKTDDAPVTVKQVVASVTVTPTSTSFASLGDTARFTAVAKDARGNLVAATTFTWSSGTTSRITINSTGLATAVANGTSTISAVAEGITGQVTATVDQVPTEITVSPKVQAYGSLEALPFSASFKDARGNSVSKTPTWSTSDATIVLVTEGGLAKAEKNGTAKVIAKYQGLADTATVNIQQVEASGFTVLPATGNGWVGAQLELSGGPRDARGYFMEPASPITWSSSDPAIATVASDGKVTVLAAGSVRITATSGLNSAFSDLTLSATAGGTINVNTTLPAGTHNIATDLTVSSGFRLKILPGATLKFAAGKKLQVSGDIVAIGTAADSIHFTSAQAVPAAGDWAGMTLAGFGSYDSDGNYLYGSGIAFADIGYAAPILIQGSTYLGNSRVHHFAYVTNRGAVHVAPSASPHIIGNTIEDNPMHGILSYGGPLIRRNIIRRNGYTNQDFGSGDSEGGGILVDGSTTVIEDNQITANKAGFFGGAIAVRWSTPPSVSLPTVAIIRNNDIKDNIVMGPPNNGSAISVRDGAILQVTNNNIENNSCLPSGQYASLDPVADCVAVIFYWHGGTSTLTGNNLANVGTYETYVRMSSPSVLIGSNFWNVSSESAARAKVKLGFQVTQPITPVMTTRISTAGPRPF